MLRTLRFGQMPDSETADASHPIGYWPVQYPTHLRVGQGLITKCLRSHPDSRQRHFPFRARSAVGERVEPMALLGHREPYHSVETGVRLVSLLFLLGILQIQSATWIQGQGHAKAFARGIR